jgi:hypothetical protein
LLEVRGRSLSRSVPFRVPAFTVFQSPSDP